jgi:hypothetical protein
MLPPQKKVLSITQRRARVHNDTNFTPLSDHWRYFSAFLKTLPSRTSPPCARKQTAFGPRFSQLRWAQSFRYILVKFSMASASPTFGPRRSPEGLDEINYEDVKSPTPTGSLSASPSPTPSPGSNSRVSSPRPIVTPSPTIHLLASNKVRKMIIVYCALSISNFFLQHIKITVSCMFQKNQEKKCWGVKLNRIRIT